MPKAGERLSEEVSVTRYAGKPFLRLIECYILDRIGQLDGKQRAALEGMTPKLRATYNRDGTWQDIVAGQMEFNDSFDSQVRASWDGYRTRTGLSNSMSGPDRFAMALADRIVGD